MADAFFEDRTMDIGSAEAESNLSQLRSDINEVRFDVVDIIEHQTADGNGLQILIGRIAAHDACILILRSHGQRNEYHESTGFILKIPNLQRYGGYGPHGSRSIRTAWSCASSCQAYVRYGERRGIDLRWLYPPSSSDGIGQTEFRRRRPLKTEDPLLQFLKYFLRAKSANASEEFNLRRGIGFQGYFRETRAQCLQGIYIVLERHMVIMSANDVKFTNPG